jgi:hypothetical protein
MAEDQDRIIDTIRRLKEEAEAERYEMPGAMSIAVNHPGVFSHQIKTQPHYERDMQRASWLDKISKLRDQEVHEGRGFPWPNGKVRDAVERRGELKTPYWNRGALAFGQPLRNGADWMQAFASTNMNIGRMLGGDESAADDLQQSGDRLLFGLPSAVEGKPNAMQLAWEAERKAEENRPIDDLAFAGTGVRARFMPRVESLPYEKGAATGMTSGPDIAIPLFGDNMLGRAAGVGIDIVTDPVNEAVSAIRALSRGALRQGASGLAAEGTLPAVMFGVSENMNREVAEKVEEIKRQRGLR